MENVAPINGNVIPLSDEDAELLREALSAIVSRQNALGVEMERHLDAVAALHGELKHARDDVASLVGVLSKKYCKRPGKWDFRADMSAFIEREEGNER